VHPHGHHHREVERRDAGHDSERLTEGVGVDVGRHLLGELTLEQRRDARGELHDFEPTGDLTLGVVDRLAVLVGHDAREFVDVLVDERAHREHDPSAAQHADVAPVVKRLRRRLHRRIDVGGLREQHLSLLLTRRGVPYDTVPG
jgi:hypothetical protein